MQKIHCKFHPKKSEQADRGILDLLETTYMCFSPSCKGQFYCNQCQKQHHKHSHQYFNLEAAMDMMQEFLFSLKQKGSSRVGKSAQVLQKFMLLERFKVNLDQKWQEIQYQLFSFLNCTENLIHHYTEAKKRVEGDLKKLDDGEIDPSFIYETYRLSQTEKLQLQREELHQLDQTWKDIVFSLIEGQSQFKDYAMKTIQIITDSDYDILDKKTQGEASKFSQLHQELKQKLEGKFASKAGSESTKLENCPSQIESLKSSKGKQKCQNKEKIELRRREKKKSESQVWLAKILDLYQVKEH